MKKEHFLNGYFLNLMNKKKKDPYLMKIYMNINLKI